MAVKFRMKGEKIKYDFLDAACIGKTCFSPGCYQHRGAVLGGSRATGDVSYTCLMRAYHGCPSERKLEDQLKKHRKAEGWKKA